MKRFLQVILFLIPVVSARAQLYVPLEHDVECSVFLKKETGGGAQQGLEIWGDCIFSFEDGGHVNVYNFRSASTKPVAGFDLASSRPDNHANNAEFGVETKSGASFPLLYVSNGKVGSEIEWTCFVESITKKGRKWSSELVQKINLDISGWKDCGFFTIFGAPSWLVDRERNELWVFSAVKRTVYSVTENAWENLYVATKFRIPSLSEGPVVNLGVNDILDQVVFPFDVWFTQAGCVRDGKIYYCFGLGRQEHSYPASIRIYDTDRRMITARYDVSDLVIYEPEDIVVKDGWIYVNTNTDPAKTDDASCIFRLSLPKPSPVPSNAFGELQQCPDKTGGAYYAGDCQNSISSKAPAGYKPFYINGYFRHGARQIDDAETYSAVFGSLEKAAESDNLTPFGKALWERLSCFRRNVLYREGDLTWRGYRQSVSLGRRMAVNYPEVFSDRPFLKAEATNVLRVASTMQAVNHGILSRFPDLEWDVVESSRACLPWLNPYSADCPGILDIDLLLKGKGGPWYSEYCAYWDSRIDSNTILSKIFKDDTVAEEYGGARNLVYRFWLMASVMQCLDRQVPIWDIFTAEEAVAIAKAEAYKYYIQKGPGAFGRSSALACRTLRHLLEESREDISLGRHGINLNFGHDGVLMAVLSNMRVETWAVEAATPDDVLELWKTWNIPMGANLQMVFYKKGSSVLVRFMLNEKDIKLPLRAVEGCFYHWDDVYSHLSALCDDSEKQLDDIKKNFNIN